MKMVDIIWKGNHVFILATTVLIILLYGYGSFTFTGFFSAQVFLNLFIDNAYLIIVATGMAFVIITGGIDLSVGAFVALISMISATLLEMGFNAYLVIVLTLLIGVLFGGFQGYLISQFDLHPWIVTLAGMFLARGTSFLINTESIVITNETYSYLSSAKVPIIGGGYVSIGAIIALLLVIIAIFIAKYTKFGRNVYAVGGNVSSARLMGLPVKRTTILVYMFSGFCSALGGFVFTIYMLSGYGLHLLGMEMDAIAACVIGGILLTGGFGYLIGPMLGVLSMGVIQTIIMFQGTLSSWWTKIAVGFLLFIFIVLQRLVVINRRRKEMEFSKELNVKPETETFTRKQLDT
ncbi:monosaccharide ABC transporter membrane protein, CUT2 family (TC 3.A.1.2.-) [Gracilibacillus orientalis]|uniref:Monosaccharide ABC transporter membrane protein, CUT2 family (TC 3.A.1.2.-) n=1 Tax=Gracilibacillus orientalis TaxID=334253 RepID=A0A1I4HW34_9BACI|nr:galactofuranose ABC transporter, permease protein YjfF [Gracilibacillus orientalis]SFL45851.1 monosaccharide ABC transporter membrane protein, CUT2 family (TC 3.A.1.2.-) [Gracilibacillus orientalis]